MLGEGMSVRGLTRRWRGRMRDKVPSSDAGARRSAQPLGDQMLTIAIDLFFPIATAAFLLHIRRKYGAGTYLLWSLPFLTLAVCVWLTTSDVVYYYFGRLCSSGFESWGAPLAVAALVAICAFALRRPWLRWLQGVTAFVAFNFCL